MVDDEDIAAVQYRPIPGFSKYRAGDDGSIWIYTDRSMRRVRVSLSSHGYYRTMIRTDEGQPVSVYVHTLILLAFKGPRPEGLHCCHGNGDRTDNRPSNLRWDTPGSNSADRLKHSAGQRGGLRCPDCGVEVNGDTGKVVDSRPSKGGIRRRRACECGRRFTTYERIQREHVEIEKLARRLEGLNL